MSSLVLLVQRLPLWFLVVVDGTESSSDCQDLESSDDDGVAFEDSSKSANEIRSSREDMAERCDVLV
jgi:hypothetical protein